MVSYRLGTILVFRFLDLDLLSEVPKTRNSNNGQGCLELEWPEFIFTTKHEPDEDSDGRKENPDIAIFTQGHTQYELPNPFHDMLKLLKSHTDKSMWGPLYIQGYMSH